MVGEGDVKVINEKIQYKEEFIRSYILNILIYFNNFHIYHLSVFL